ncbi:DUF7688 family protein [Noviherbaspirillum pedocola]|uniref:DUF7688 domain-containing protein n=1 Tax=Noviherbaspirillum pedocola TaxID=2801341 RepID=A0A934W7Y4_9BURK|nr:hypothetical protein [Noviherbaspirillum pedocola]MBK4736168.1 hypothetical protein [Noviherbaspirillum pedocola]
MAEFSLRLNGQQIMTGDDVSCRVIFNNLSGRNFQNRELWQTQSYEDYLAWMGAHLRVLRWSGEVTLHDEDGEEIDQHAFVASPEGRTADMKNVFQIGSVR